MTTQKTFKRRIRERMEKTGESYTAARHVLIAKASVPGWEPPVTEDALVRGTGHGWEHWLSVLDQWGGTAHTHTEMARWLVAEHGVSGWWSQSITVGFERARGLRAVGERSGGFTADVTRTVAVPVEALFAGWVELATELPLRERTATPPKRARYDWEDGPTRVHVTFAAKGNAKSVISLSHERLADKNAVDTTKLFWRGQLTYMKNRLEKVADQV